MKYLFHFLIFYSSFDKINWPIKAEIVLVILTETKKYLQGRGKMKKYYGESWSKVVELLESNIYSGLNQGQSVI